MHTRGRSRTSSQFSGHGRRVREWGAQIGLEVESGLKEGVSLRERDPSVWERVKV